MNTEIGALQTDNDGVKKKRAETMLPTSSGPEPQRPITEVTMRSAGQQYSDSTRANNPEHLSNWQAVGDLARKLVLDMAKRKAEAGHADQQG